MYSSRSVAIHRAAVTAIVLLAVVLASAQGRALWLLDSPLPLYAVWPYTDLIFSVYAAVLALVLVLSWKAPCHSLVRDYGSSDDGAEAMARLPFGMMRIIRRGGIAGLR